MSRNKRREGSNSAALCCEFNRKRPSGKDSGGSCELHLCCRGERRVKKDRPGISSRAWQGSSWAAVTVLAARVRSRHQGGASIFGTCVLRELCLALLVGCRRKSGGLLNKKWHPSSNLTTSTIKPTLFGQVVRVVIECDGRCKALRAVGAGTAKDVRIPNKRKGQHRL